MALRVITLSMAPHTTTVVQATCACLQRTHRTEDEVPCSDREHRRVRELLDFQQDEPNQQRRECERQALRGVR
eukprot:52307-Eustigmatos_ZCMA.PRE.1